MIPLPSRRLADYDRGLIPTLADTVRWHGSRARRTVQRCARHDYHAAGHFLRAHGLKLATAALVALAAYVLPLRAAELAAMRAHAAQTCTVHP